MSNMPSLPPSVQVAYSGPANAVMDYFSSVGLHCSLHYNPADFISECAVAQC